VAGFNSGRLFFDHGLQLLCGSSRQCAQTQASIYDLIRISGAFSANINIGMFRGMPPEEDQAPAIESLVAKLRQLADYAAHLDVRLLLEPANKQEFPFISSTREGLEILERVNRPNVNLMLDTFHMAVEGEDICESLELAMPHLYHIHFLDLDRNPPGHGSRGVDLEAVIACLVRSNYRYFLSMPLVKDASDEATREVLMDIRRAIADAETYRIGG
jgi:sugar phosphate isomerase/epimerase